LDVQTAPIPEAAQHEPLAKRSKALGWTILSFALAWAVLYGLWRGLPYLKNGSDVVFSAKLQWEHQGRVFPANRLFADQTHLNQAGARVYTEALFLLLKDRPHALQ